MIPNQQVSLHQDRVFIGNGRWTEKVSLQVKSITEWHVRELHLFSNQRAEIIKEIAHVRFVTLTSLRLANNGIDSIERLCSVHVPHIERLWLNCNNITSVRVMRKVGWGLLVKLFIENNYFGDGKDLAEGLFPRLQKLWVYDPLVRDENTFTEQSFPAKMQAASLKNLSIKQQVFRFNRSIQRAFKKRWPDPSII